MIRCCAVVLLAIVASGCKETRAPHTGVPANLGENGLEELASVYKYIAQNKEQVPRKLEDLTEKQAALPTAWGKIESGEYIVQWGAGVSGSGGAVLAYEKSAPDSGGLVLLQDGTVKQLTAAEFKAAPKAR